MNIFNLLLIALSVSLDSFFCGLSASMKINRNFKTILGIILSVFILSVIGSFLGEKAGESLKNTANLLGGTILSVIAVIDYFSEKKENENGKFFSRKNNNFLQGIVLGLAVGIDGAVGCFTLSLLGVKGLIAPLTVTAFHLVLLILAFLITDLSFAKKLAKKSFIAPLILFLLGIYKIISGII